MTVRFLLIAALFMGGCATSPPSRYYTLSGPPAAVAPQPAGMAIVVGPVAIPAVVDRPEIVITLGENEVWLDEFNRWAAPLADAIALATAENLAAVLGTQRVRLLAQTTEIDGDYRVAIEVQRFESAPGSYALLDAVYSVRRVADGATLSGRTTKREAVSDKSYDTLAAAHSRAVAQLANDIAAALRTLAARAPSPAR